MVLVSALGQFLTNSVEPDELGAPVGRELLSIAGAASGIELLTAIFGRYLASPETGHWIFIHGLVRFGMRESHAFATISGSLALVMLAVDALLVSGAPVGDWARHLCVGQVVIAGIACLPVALLLSLAVFTIAVWIVIGVLLIAVLVMILAGMAGG